MSAVLKDDLHRITVVVQGMDVMHVLPEKIWGGISKKSDIYIEEQDVESA